MSDGLFKRLLLDWKALSSTDTAQYEKLLMHFGMKAMPALVEKSHG